MKITLPPITKGDWHVVPGFFVQSTENDGEYVCSVDASEKPRDARANQTAIAALPALLRALSECVAWIDSVAEIKPEDLQAYLDNSLEHVEGRCNYALTLAGCVIEP